MNKKIVLIEQKENTKKYFKLWNDFVANDSNNGTIFHRLDFLSYHGNRFEGNKNHLMFFKNSTLIAVMPLGIFCEEGEKIAKSPFGASFGGVVIKKKVPLMEVEEMVKLLVAYLKDKDVDFLRMVCPPKIYEEIQNDSVDFFMLKYGAKFFNADLTSYICISENILNNFASHARRNVKTALNAGLEFSESEDIDSFYAILVKNRKEKFDVAPTHSLEEICWLYNKFPNNFKIFLVTHQATIVASMMIIVCKSNIIYAFYWAHKEEYQHLRPINFIFYKLIEYAQKNNFSYIDFGPQTLKQELFYGVVNFKESIGGQGMLRNSYLMKVNEL